MPRSLTLTALIVLLLALAGCAQTEPLPTEEAFPVDGGFEVLPAEETFESPVYVNTASLITENERIRVSVQGDLADSCTEIDGIEQEILGGDTIALDLVGQRPADEECTQALVPFEQSVPVNTSGLADGSYMVTINGVLAGRIAVSSGDATITDPGTGSVVDASTEACPEPGEGQQQVISELMGVCLLVPEGYNVAQPEDRLLTITGNGSTLVISAVVSGDSLEGIVEGAMGDTAADSVSQNQRTVTSGQPMTVVEGLPTDGLSAFISANGFAYRLELSPMDEALWGTVTETLTIIPVRIGDPIGPEGDVQPPDEGDTDG